MEQRTNGSNAFIDDIARQPGGERVIHCIQCGTCSGSCPTVRHMDYSPRRLFAMIRAGMRREVLESNTFWLCTSCYTCTVRCPREIKITEVMYALKREAIKAGLGDRGAAARSFYRTFVSIIERDGRSFEPELMARHMIRTNPAAMIGAAPLGVSLLRHKRFPLRPTRIRGRRQIAAIIKAAKSRENK